MEFRVEWGGRGLGEVMGGVGGDSGGQWGEIPKCRGSGSIRGCGGRVRGGRGKGKREVSQSEAGGSELGLGEGIGRRGKGGRVGWNQGGRGGGVEVEGR